MINFCSLSVFINNQSKLASSKIHLEMNEACIISRKITRTSTRAVVNDKSVASMLCPVRPEQ